MHNYWPTTRLETAIFLAGVTLWAVAGAIWAVGTQQGRPARRSPRQACPAHTCKHLSKDNLPLGERAKSPFIIASAAHL